MRMRLTRSLLTRQLRPLAPALGLALALTLALAAPGRAGDDGYLIPPSPAAEEPIVLGAPRVAATPRVEVRDTLVERPLAFQSVAFGSPPDTVAEQLSRFDLRPVEKAHKQGLAYAGSGELLGDPAMVAALFTPSTRRLFSLSFTTILERGKPWSLNRDRYLVRRRLLSEKYGPPTREMEAPAAAETVWCFLDGELQCSLDATAVRLVYVHEPGLELARDEQEALRGEEDARLKEQL